MSSRKTEGGGIEAWLLMIGCAVAVGWYAIPQLLYSLVFLYQVARAVFPEIVPPIAPP